MSTLLTLGLVGVGGYLFVTKVWPMIEDMDFNFLGGSSGSYGSPPEYYRPNVPQRGIGPIIEDRFPDYIVEDRYPDYYIEDRYPDYYPYPYPVPQPYPYPYIPPSYPQYCGPGRYWNGDRCKKIDIDCPSGYREDDGICKPRDRDRNCDRDEFWNGHRCEKLPRIPLPRPDRDRPDRDRDRIQLPPPITKLPKPDKKTERRFNNTRDKWHDDRDKEAILTGKPVDAAGSETKRVQEVAEKATQSFLEVWYA